MALEAFHHRGASRSGGRCPFAAIHRKNDGIGADALGHTDPDPVEAGDFREARDACGEEVWAHTSERLLGCAGALGSVNADLGYFQAISSERSRHRVINLRTGVVIRVAIAGPCWQ